MQLNDEDKELQCGPKAQYTHIYVDMDGKATSSCKQTRSYYNRKSSRPTSSDFRARIKEEWSQLKPEREQKERKRKDALEKLKVIQEER